MTSESAEGAPIERGDEIGGFVIEAVAGKGGMGVVYRARQRKPARLVALKVIAPDVAHDPDFRARFERESTIAAQIEHPNVIPVHAAGEDKGVLYIAMRFIPGINLQTLIAEQGRLKPVRAAAIIDQVAQALAAAHERGLVHRDVKPANILLSISDDRDHAYLTDFGICRRVEASQALTQPGTLLGTFDYIAPEQAKGEPIDARTDVYALGCVLFHALTGSVPFPRDTDAAKLFAHVTQPPPSVRERAPDVPASFDSVLIRAMAKAPDECFGSAKNLGRAAVGAATPAATADSGVAPNSPVATDGTGRRLRRSPTARGTRARRVSSSRAASETNHRGDAGRRRPSVVWLTTVSTVAAVAVGMFSIRNQLFPQQAGNAQASVDSYQVGLGRICDDLNEADRVRAKSSKRLGAQLSRAGTTTAQRNAVLDSWNLVLDRSQHDLGLFEGLNVPDSLLTRVRGAQAVWTRIVARIQDFAQRLDAVGDRNDLVAAVRTLPSTRTALDREGVALTADLTNLGAGHCKLAEPVPVPTISLPAAPTSVSAGSAAGASIAPATNGDVEPGPGVAASPTSSGASPTRSGTPVRPSVDAPALVPAEPLH